MTMPDGPGMPDDRVPPSLLPEPGHAVLFHALAEPPRLLLLNHLASGEHRVRDLVAHLHLAQSTVSKHLACLRDCGLVEVRTEGRASWYSLADPEHLTALLRAADALLGAADAPLTLPDHRPGGDLDSGHSPAALRDDVASGSGDR